MRSRRAETLLWLGGAAGIAVIAILQTTVFYRASPMIGVALPVALALAAVVLARPMLGACAALAAVPLEIVGTQVSPMEAMLLLTAGSVLLRVAFQRLHVEVDPLFFVLAAAVMWMIAGYGIALDGFTVMRTVLMWTSAGVVALLVSNASRSQVQLVLWAIVVGAAMTAIIALAAGSTLEARAGATAVEGRAQGSFTHPSQLAFFLVMALPPALVLAVRSQAALRLAASGAALVILTALILTLTRGAIIGAGVSLAIMLVWLPFRRIAAVVLVGLLVFAVANSDALSRSQQLALVGDRIATVVDRDAASVNNNRLRIWSTVPQIVGDHPVFGVGVGNFAEYSFRYGLSEGGEPFGHAHNVGLTVLAEQGIPGALLLLVALALMLRLATEALRHRRHPDFAYALAPIAGLGGLFVNSLTDYPPGSNPNMALLLIEIGLLVAAARLLRAPQS